MRLTTFTDYALRVLLHAATAPDGRATIAGVARTHAISEHHLVKVVHRLGKAGLLANTRGRGGGLRLARDAATITLGEVVRLTEGETVLADCFAGGAPCPLLGRCRLNEALRQADDAFHAVLDRHTLLDLLPLPGENIEKDPSPPHRMRMPLAGGRL